MVFLDCEQPFGFPYFDHALPFDSFAVRLFAPLRNAYRLHGLTLPQIVRQPLSPPTEL